MKELPQNTYNTTGLMPAISPSKQIKSHNSMTYKPKPKLNNLSYLLRQAEKPLMGVSYLAGYAAEKSRCYLCNKDFHMNLIVGHLIGNSHRIKYCVS